MIEKENYFVIFAVPSAGWNYEVRVAELKLHSPLREMEVDAATLYDWLRLCGYHLQSDKVMLFEEMVLNRVPSKALLELGFSVP